MELAEVGLFYAVHANVAFGNQVLIVGLVLGSNRQRGLGSGGTTAKTDVFAISIQTAESSRLKSGRTVKIKMVGGTGAEIQSPAERGTGRVG